MIKKISVDNFFYPIKYKVNIYIYVNVTCKKFSTKNMFVKNVSNYEMYTNVNLC